MLATAAADVGPVDEVSTFLADKEYFSDSSLGLFQSCRRKFMYSKHWLLDGGRWSVSADAGNVLHYGLATLHRTGGDIEAMFDAAETYYDRAFAERGDVENAYTKGNLLDILLGWVKHWRHFPYQVDPDMVEVAALAKITDFWYVGRMDLVPRKTQYGDGFTNVDFKSTKSGIDDFGSKFTPNRQFTGNAYLLQQIFKEHARLNGVVDGILVSPSQRGYTRWELSRRQADLDEWERETVEIVRQIRDARDRNVWPQNTKECNSYGRCPFDELCITHVNQAMLRKFVRTNRSDPLHFRD